MWKRIVGCAGIVASLALVPALVKAQDATPTGAVPPMDLTAMVLFPGDVPGGGMALDRGYFEDPVDMVSAMADRTGKSEQKAQADLDAFGYGRRYALRMAEAWPVGVATPVAIDNPWGKTVTTIVSEFPSTQDAAAAFTYIEQEAEDAGSLAFYTVEEDWPLDTVIGDEAELTYAVGMTSDSQQPYTTLNLTFRSGNLIGDVMVDDFLGREPDPGEVEGLAEQLLARMDAVRNGEMPDLGQRVLRFAGPTYSDSYTRLNGIYIPRHGETAEVTAEMQAQSNAQAVYTRDQDIEGTAQPAYMTSQTVQFASPDDAAAFDLDTPRQRLADDPIYETAETVAGSPTLGDASAIFRYVYADTSDYAGWSGYGVVARSGPLVIILYLEQSGDVALETAMEMAKVQLACATGTPCPDEQPVPASLLAPTATPVAQATPAT